MSVSASSPVLPFSSPDSLVPTLPSENAATAPSRLHMFAGDDNSPSFWDVLDVINPLQHIPIVNSIYRELTGDQIGVGARLVGGGLLGGPIGLIGAALNSVIEEATGRDAGGHLIALFKGDAASPPTALAANTRPAAAPAAPASAPDLAAAPAASDNDESAARPLLLPDMAGLDAAPKTLALAAETPAAALAQQAAAPPPRPIAAEALPAAPPSPAAVPLAQVAAAEGTPMPLLNGRDGRPLKLPGRTTAMATRSPPALGISTSTSGIRSNTPITGAASNRLPVSPAMVQQMAAGSGTAATPAAASGDWFSGAMIDGLSKYERNARLGKAAAPTVSELQ